MLKPALIGIVLCTWLSTAVFAQRRAPVISPETSVDGSVTFRFAHDLATEVQVAGQWPNGNIELVKGSDGVWQATVADIPPGVWEYSLKVNGITMIDPSNAELKPMRNPRTSILHLPSKPLAPHDFQDVPHGTVHLHDYASKAAGDVRQFAVYTPPGYEKSTATYPTLYLQHGSGDNHATWVTHGKAHWIVDHMIASGKAKSMIVVMLNGHVAPATQRDRNTQLFEEDLLHQVLPMVEATYRVNPDASSRAICGLSMGGGQSLTIGLNHSDMFAWVGGFSAAAPSDESIKAALDNPEVVNKNLQLLWIACGKQDFLLDRNVTFTKTLSDRQIEHQWLETEGDHSWPVWRTYLADFVPKLFQ